MAVTLEYSGIDPSNGLVCEPSFELAMLADLPHELLFAIIHDLDNESLFNLSLTCRRMNTIALNHFFSKNGIRHTGAGYSIPLRTDLPIQTIPALRSALFVHHIQFFYFLLKGNAKMMREDVADLGILAARLHTIETLWLSIADHSLSLPEMRI